MTLYMIIDKQTKLFLRDDFVWNPETEEAISTPCPQGLNQPMWVEGTLAITDEENNMLREGTLGEWVEAL